MEGQTSGIPTLSGKGPGCGSLCQSPGLQGPVGLGPVPLSPGLLWCQMFALICQGLILLVWVLGWGFEPLACRKHLGGSLFPVGPLTRHRLQGCQTW